MAIINAAIISHIFYFLFIFLLIVGRPERGAKLISEHTLRAAILSVSVAFGPGPAAHLVSNKLTRQPTPSSTLKAFVATPPPPRTCGRAPNQQHLEPSAALWPPPIPSSSCQSAVLEAATTLKRYRKCYRKQNDLMAAIATAWNRFRHPPDPGPFPFSFMLLGP